MALEEDRREYKLFKRDSSVPRRKKKVGDQEKLMEKIKIKAEKSISMKHGANVLEGKINEKEVSFGLFFK